MQGSIPALPIWKVDMGLFATMSTERCDRSALAMLLVYHWKTNSRQKTAGGWPCPEQDPRLARLLTRAYLDRDLREEQKAEQHAKVEAVRASSVKLLGKIVDDYIEHAEKELRPRTVREIRRYLRVHWHPLHDVIADELTTDQIVDRLTEISRDNGEIASKPRTCLLIDGVLMGDETAKVQEDQPQPCHWHPCPHRRRQT